MDFSVNEVVIGDDYKEYRVLGSTLTEYGDLVYTLMNAKGELSYSIGQNLRKRDFAIQVDVDSDELKEFLEESRLPKYSVGDKVRVREDLVCNRVYNMENGEDGDMVVDEMMDLIGNIVTITSNKYGYKIKEDGERFNWSDNMFDGFVEEEPIPKTKYNVGDKVRVRSDLIVDRVYGMESVVYNDCFVEQMEEFKGKVVTIASNNGKYNIEEDFEQYNYTDEMFEGVVDTEEVDMVNHPPHYNVGGIESIDVIRMSLTKKEFKGYLKGQVLKYRERAQFKGNAEQDYAKAKFYYDMLMELEAKKKSKKKSKKRRKK